MQIYIYGCILKAKPSRAPCSRCITLPGCPGRGTEERGRGRVTVTNASGGSSWGPPSHRGACRPVTDTTRVTETRSSSWEMAPGSHIRSFFPPERGITATVHRGHRLSPGLARWWDWPWRFRGGDRAGNSSLAPFLPCNPGTQDGNCTESPKLSDAPRCFSPTWASPRSTCGAASPTLTQDRQPAPYTCLCPHTTAPVPGVPTHRAATQSGWGARGRRNSPCRAWCWQVPSKQNAPPGWSGAVKTPKKSTKVGTRLLLVLHATILSLIYSVFLEHFSKGT